MGVLAVSSQSLGAEPVRETFTYQGVLKDGGVPANGMYDIRFEFFDELGVTLGGSVAYLEFEVVDGQFSIPLALTNLFTFGNRRFIQVSVRLAGVGVYSDLSPRQEVMAAPFAVYAIKAGEAETAEIADVSLDNEWSRSGSIVSAGSGVDRVMLNPGLTGGAMLNSSTDLQLNFDDSGFGGMYINSQDSGGAPFYGFAHDNSPVAYIEYRESLDQVRFFNFGGPLPTLALGNTTATVPILSAETEIVKDYGTSQYHRNGPIAYGVFNFDGSLASGTPNISAVWEPINARYIVHVDGESLHFLDNTVVVTAINSSPVIGTTDSVNGDLLVYFHTLSNVNIQMRFNIVIYENAPVSVD